MSMIVRFLIAVAAVLMVAVIACGVIVLMAQTTVPVGGRAAKAVNKAPQQLVQKSGTAVPPGTAKAQAAAKASAKNGEETEPKPRPTRGAPEHLRQYTLAEAETAIAKAQEMSAADPEYRDALNQWYTCLADPSFTQSESYEEHIKKLEAMAEQSQSPTPLIAMAKARLLSAWHVRGKGPPEEVSEAARNWFVGETAAARRILERAVGMGVKDGEAYALLIETAAIEGRPLSETRALFEQGRKIDPTYLDLYNEMAEYLLPRWHGEPGDVERFAAEMAESIGGEEGLDVYAHIAYAANQYDTNLLYWGEFDRALLVKGAEGLVKRYPDARNLVPFAALCTVVAQDQAAAKRIRPAVKYNDAPRAWAWQHLSTDYFRWCQATEIDSGQADWLWGAPVNYGSLVFSRDSKRLWCATGYGPNTVMLWNLDTKKPEIVLSAIGRLIGSLAVDENQKLIAATLRDERQEGLLLWDISQPEAEPYLLPTKEACEAVTIHPKLPQVAFAVGKSVRKLDFSKKMEGPSIETEDFVRGIRFSADGQLIAAWGTKLSVWDSAAGTKRYDLPIASDGTNAEISCEQILDIDEEGRVWAIGFEVGSRPVKRSLVRFSRDGKSREPIIADLQTRGPVQPLTAVLSADRRRLAISDEIKQPGEPESIQVWDVAAAKSQGFIGHEQHIGCYAFSPDGRKLASVIRGGGVVKVWRLDSEQGK